MDQAGADMKREKPQSPQHDQDDDDSLAADGLLSFFRFSSSFARPSSVGKEEKLSVYCRFHTKCGRAIGMSENRFSPWKQEDSWAPGDSKPPG